MSATDLSTTIAENATSVASASADGTSATAKSVTEVIAADRYLAAKVGITKKLFGITVQPIVPGGPVGRYTGTT